MSALLNGAPTGLPSFVPGSTSALPPNPVAPPFPPSNKLSPSQPDPLDQSSRAPLQLRSTSHVHPSCSSRGRRQGQRRRCRQALRKVGDQRVRLPFFPPTSTPTSRRGTGMYRGSCGYGRRGERIEQQTEKGRADRAVDSQCVQSGQKCPGWTTNLCTRYYRVTSGVRR